MIHVKENLDQDLTIATNYLYKKKQIESKTITQYTYYIYLIMLNGS